MTSILPPTKNTKTGKTVSFGDQVLSSKILPYMRSRNIEFTCKKLRPLTRIYSFFGGVDVNRFVVPKLIEITMNSGVFQVGETVIGSFDIPTANSPAITFRVANQNHKYGTYNSPSDIFTINPYAPTTNIPESYSSTSSILNVDTYSLSNQPQGEFRGYISAGMKLRGQSSKAQATVTQVRLITDQTGVLIGSFFVPDGNVDINPRFECGTKMFRVTSSSTNSLVTGTFTTSAEEKFVAEGKVNTVQENLIVTRPIRIELPPTETVILPPGVDPPPYIPGDPPAPRPPRGGGGGGGGGGVAPAPMGAVAPAPMGPAPVGVVAPVSPAKTTVYYNYGEPKLFDGGANRLKDLAKSAGLPKDLIKKIDADMSKKQQQNITNKINNSAYANQAGIQVSTGNIVNGKKVELPKASPMGPAPKAAVVQQGSKTGGGTPPKAAPAPAAPAPKPAPAPARAPAAPAPRPAPAPAPSPMGGSPGGGGKKSDIRLKKNILIINNALEILNTL